MDIQSIEAFLAVSDTGSFSRAADTLFLSQPAISKRIQTLEHTLDITPFDRVGKSVRLTEAGHALLPSCRRIIEQIEEGKRIINESDVDVIAADDLKDGAEKIVKAVKG